MPRYRLLPRRVRSFSSARRLVPDDNGTIKVVYHVPNNNGVLVEKYVMCSEVPFREYDAGKK